MFGSTNAFCYSFSCRINCSYLVGHQKTNMVFNTFESTLELALRLLTDLLENRT